MGKREKKSNLPLLIAVAFVAVIIGVAGTWVYTQGNYTEGFSAGVAYQQGLELMRVPASLTCSLGSSTFANFSTEVTSDGAVATEVNKYTNLTITNSDDSRTAGSVHVTLYNPVTSKQGLDNDLETDSTEYAVTSGDGTYMIYNEGAYVTNGFKIGDIPAGGEWTIMQTMTLETASAGTFEDAQSYTCHLYVYQEDADYSDVVVFTVVT